MAILFHPNIRNLLIGRGVLGGLNSTVAVTVFSGTQPPAASIVSNWSSVNTSVILHYTGVGWSHPLSGTVTFASITTFPTAATALQTAVGSWCIIWAVNTITQANVTSTTLPSNNFIVGPVSTLSGNGIVRFNPSVSFTSGLSYSIADGVISASST